MLESIKQKWSRLPKPIRKITALLAGIVVIAAGAAMLVLPGPGWLVIFLGLAILATEYAFAERIKVKVMHHVQRTTEAAKKHFKKPKN